MHMLLSTIRLHKKNLYASHMQSVTYSLTHWCLRSNCVKIQCLYICRRHRSINLLLKIKVSLKYSHA